MSSISSISSISFSSSSSALEITKVEKKLLLDSTIVEGLHSPSLESISNRKEYQLVVNAEVDGGHRVAELGIGDSLQRNHINTLRQLLHIGKHFLRLLVTNGSLADIKVGLEQLTTLPR